MKKLEILMLALAFSLSLIAQPDTTLTGKVRVTEDQDKTVVKIGEDSIVTIEEKNDTTHIKLGNKGITIIEGEDGTKINMNDLSEEKEEEEHIEKKHEGHNKFKADWAGVQLGLNNYVDKNFSLSRSESDAYMDLNTARSWNFNVNFLEYGLPLGTEYLGLVTGLGAEWSNYFFDQGNTIEKDGNGMIQEVLPPSDNVIKSRLQTAYLTMPLLLEVKIPAGKKKIHVSGGVIGGLKVTSNTKVVYRENGDKQKDKIHDDFNLSSLRYGLSCNIGYRGLNLYANYYLTPLFEKNKGPELYPFAIGLTLLSF